LNGAGGPLCPLWLRTCYNPEFAEAYDELKREVFGEYEDSFQEGQVLEEEALYGDYGDLSVDWTNILLRIPNLVDVGQGGELDNYGPHYPVDWKWEDYEDPDEEFKKPFHEADRETVTMVCLIDEVALRENVVRLMFLNAHGKWVWDNKMDAETFNTFMVCGYLLSEYVEGQEPHNFERGALSSK
jgi:hypothetical protein